MKEFVNGHLGSREPRIYQITIPNMERDTEEVWGKKQRVLKIISEISTCASWRIEFPEVDSGCDLRLAYC